MTKRRTLHIGEIVVSPEGDISPTDSSGKPWERLTTQDVPLDISIPAPYVAQKFLASDFKSYRPANASQAAALAATREFCQRIHAGEAPLLALIGSTGTGKSHLLYSAAKGLHSVGHRVFTRPWYLLADHLRYGGPALFSPSLLEPQQLRDALMRETIVMIDEVRPTAGTDFDDTELAKIVCHAWDNGRAVLVTTNVSPLSAVVGPAVASRFTQITIQGPDHRQANA
jgi:chromosomal replication initiation ATPase DnaA